MRPETSALTLARVLLPVLVLSVVIEEAQAASSFKSKCPKLKVKNGRVRLRSKGLTAHFQCKKKFSLIGKKSVICLRTGAWSHEPPVCAGRECPRLNINKNVKVTRKNGGALLKFQCRMGFQRIGPESVYCTGKRWSDRPPSCVVASSLECDFENESQCGWSNSMDDDFDWTRHSGDTPTAMTGPHNDHTTNTNKGHYMYIESSSPSRNGWSARLTSPLYRPDQLENACFEFFYHMYGHDINDSFADLDVYVKQVKGDKKVTAVQRIFHKTGNQGDNWHRADVDIPSYDDPLMFIFEATRKQGWRSDIAIDDVRIYNCSERYTSSAIPPTTTTTTRKTTTISTTTTTPAATTSTTTRTSSISTELLNTNTPISAAPTANTTAPIGTRAADNTRSKPRSTLHPMGKVTTTVPPVDIDDVFDDSDSNNNTSVDTTTNGQLQQTTTSSKHITKNHSDSSSSTYDRGAPTSTTIATSRATLTHSDAGQTGQVRGAGRRGSESESEGGIVGKLPLILGVVAAVFIVVAIISVVAYTATRRRRQRQREKEREDQMIIITEFVETNLS